jgi:hypothetical protein
MLSDLVSELLGVLFRYEWAEQMEPSILDTPVPLVGGYDVWSIAHHCGTPSSLKKTDSWPGMT